MMSECSINCGILNLSSKGICNDGQNTIDDFILPPIKREPTDEEDESNKENIYPNFYFRFIKQEHSISSRDFGEPVLICNEFSTPLKEPGPGAIILDGEDNQDEDKSDTDVAPSAAAAAATAAGKPVFEINDQQDHTLSFLSKLSFVLYHCKSCSRCYHSKTGLNQHQRYECGKLPNYSCINCGKSFKRKCSHLRHCVMVHGYAPYTTKSSKLNRILKEKKFCFTVGTD